MFLSSRQYTTLKENTEIFTLSIKIGIETYFMCRRSIQIHDEKKISV